MDHRPLPRARALALLLFVVAAWGVNWPVTRALVQGMSPLWATALRCLVAAAVLGPCLWLRGELVLPRRGDVPAVTTSLGLLATPVVGIGAGAVMLGEPPEPSVLGALVLLVGGIALGVVGKDRSAPAREG